MEKLFGTDGVRGIPGRPPLTAGSVRAIATAAARLLLKRSARRVNGSAPLVLMARDTRASGPALGRSLVAGFSAAGCRTADLGVAPTPAVSYLVQRARAFCGVVVSASHNPAEFNGIKFFTGDGYKMDSGTEAQIEKELADDVELAGAEERSRTARNARGAVASAVFDGARYVDEYVEFLRSTFPPTLDLTGLRLVVDCANGAAYKIAPALFEALGARVFSLGCSPNGRNINERCGALFPGAMQREIVRRGAHCGVSFDGDADRAIFADERGVLLDGDALICLSALRLRRLGLLRSDKVVLTVMSNFGLLRFLEKQGIGVVSVPVGDRNVTEAIEKEGLSLGGEASGHLIFRGFAATGDGLLTALQTLAALRESGRPLSEHRKSFRAVPQIIRNIAVDRKVPLQELPRFRAQVARGEKRLAGEGRIFVRYSGTEPLLRIMIEGPSRGLIVGIARELENAFFEESGQGSVKK